MGLPGWQSHLVKFNSVEKDMIKCEEYKLKLKELKGILAETGHSL